jgi:phosphoglycolate phosphatase
MAIATNKRRTPTLRILEYLGWNGYFRITGTLDSTIPPHANKAALIRNILEEMNLAPGLSLYVGDKLEDGHAAEANAMPFFAASWGYGNWDAVAMPPGWRIIRSPNELTEQLNGF